MIIPQKSTPTKDFLLFIGGAATGLLGALILSGESSEESVRELECEMEEADEFENDDGTESEEEGVSQPVEG